MSRITSKIASIAFSISLILTSKLFLLTMVPQTVVHQYVTDILLSTIA